MNRTVMLILNTLLFQVVWFACVLGGTDGYPWVGTGMALMAIALHLYLVARPGEELKLILLAGALGALLDSWPVSLGWVSYPSGQFLPGMAPHWIIAMWLNFATLLNVSLSWLKGRYALAALLGAVAGPLSYYGGTALGGLSLLVDNTVALQGIALNWAVGLPLLLYLAKRFNGVEIVDETALPSGSATAERPG